MLVIVLFALVASSMAAANTPAAAASNSSINTCYSTVGCFSNQPPWTSPSRPALPPQDPFNITNSMYFYSREEPDGVIFSIYPEINLTSVPFSDNRTTFVVFHGLLGNATSPWVLALKDALLSGADAQVFVVEYHGGGSRPSFPQALGDARVVGKITAQVMEMVGVDLGSVHLIGHSLGAQIAAYTAKTIAAAAGMKVGRITGLDPVGPFFEGQPAEVRLDASDADFVEVLHTNAGGYGASLPIGHVDFYFNGGMEQPMCRQEASSSALCNHQVVHDLYIEAVSNGCMVGWPGELLVDGAGALFSVSVGRPAENGENSIIPLGLGANQSPARGVFVVLTNPTPPYCVESGGNLAPY